MKLLVVKPHLPVPPDQGTRRVTLGLLRDLAGVFDVSYLCLLERPDEARLVPQVEALGVRVRAPLAPNRRSSAHRALYRIRNDAAALLTGYPRDYYYATPGVLRRELERWTTEERFDLVLLEYWKLAPLARSVRSGRVAVLAHDAEFVKRQRQRDVLLASGGSRVTAWRLGREATREIETLRGCETVLALTDQDRDDLAAALGPAHGGEVRVLPVGTDLPAAPRGIRPVRGRVGFVGSFKGDFNVDALSHFLVHVWPRVRAEVPEATLEVAGGHVPDALLAHDGEEGVRFHGFVDDLSAFLAELWAFVVPLRFGGGLRIRLVEGLTAGTAVVATPVAVAGLGLEAGRHYLEGTTDPELADALVRVLRDELLRERLIRAGRAVAEERYGADAIRDRTVRLFRELAGESAA